MSSSSSIGPKVFVEAFINPAGILLGMISWFSVTFFRFGEIPDNFNPIHVTLIPKTVNADTMQKFSPIALANFQYKILTKILANRLSPIAKGIVSLQQSAFIRGRQISDYISLLLSL